MNSLYILNLIHFQPQGKIVKILIPLILGRDIVLSDISGSMVCPIGSFTDKYENIRPLKLPELLKALVCSRCFFPKLRHLRINPRCSLRNILFRLFVNGNQIRMTIRK